MSIQVQPVEVPFILTSLSSCGGHIGPQPEHFIVRESPLYQFSGAGQHLFVRVRKRGLTTQQLLRILSKASGVRDRDIGYAGLKDKNAVSEQWVSLLGVDAEAVEHWSLPDDVQVLEVTRHDNKLRTGHLSGNEFRITVVNAERASEVHLTALVAAIGQHGLPNYFGVQRFGHDGRNLTEALQWLDSGKRAKSRFLAKLYPSVIQAEIFNRYLSARREVGLDHLLPGEVVRLDGSGKMFVVEDASLEQPRLVSGDVHLTGPIWGPKAKAASGEALALEQQVIADLGLGPEDLQRLGASAPGSRRDLIMPVSDARFELLGPDSFALEFSLPAGSYATQVVREFTR